MDALHAKLAHAVTRWDRRQETKKCYNPNALAIYLGRIADVAESVSKGESVHDAIRREFNDRLRDYLLRSVAP